MLQSNIMSTNNFSFENILAVVPDFKFDNRCLDEDCPFFEVDMDAKQWKITQQVCKDNCFCDYCKISKPTKQCKNFHSCGRIINRGQNGWTSGICSNDCAFELRGVNLKEKAIEKREENITKEYPHKYLPIVLIIEDEWWEDINNKLLKLI